MISLCDISLCECGQPLSVKTVQSLVGPPVQDRGQVLFLYRLFSPLTGVVGGSRYKTNYVIDYVSVCLVIILILVIGG